MRSSVDSLSKASLAALSEASPVHKHVQDPTSEQFPSGRAAGRISWCFEPSQQQRITSGLNTNFTLSPSYSFHKSLYQRPLLLKLQLKFYPQFGMQTQKNRNTCLGVYLYSAGTQHGNLHPTGKHILFYRSTQVSEKPGRGFGKNAGEWTGRVEISKEEIPGSKRSMNGYILIYSRL